MTVSAAPAAGEDRLGGAGAGDEGDVQGTGGGQHER
jgi:hypothetical protein